MCAFTSGDVDFSSALARIAGYKVYTALQKCIFIIIPLAITPGMVSCNTRVLRLNHERSFRVYFYRNVHNRTSRRNYGKFEDAREVSVITTY